uniref:Alpha-mannosidase n=1 Tax=Meloidogyne javanica TaxID=6303 RepID=A0A915N495_MELJA
MSFPAKSTIILAFGMFVVISIMLYLKVDSNERRRQATYGDSNILTKITVSDVGIETFKVVNRHTSSANSLQFCSFKNQSLPHNAVSDVQMLSVYDILPFDNPNGGVWKQGWPITYDYQKIKEEKRLEVIVIPHSHCDPGWIKTFEKYYEDQVQNILNFMVTYLTQNKDLKFIFAEISFFELWWSKQTNKIREKVKQLLINGQFEIVTGGWVMTDEANAHYYSIIMELFEGHEFLKNQLVPTNISTLYNSLVNARRALSLFQHHDGVTGTAKSLVMDDYGEKMSQALSDTKNIIARSSEFLLGITPEEANQQQKFKIDLKHFKNKLAKKIIIKEESTLIITNSLGHFRKEIVCIYVNNIKFKIVGNDGKTILQQIEPIFFTDNLNELSIYKDKYSLCFEVELPPFGLITLNVLESENVENKVKLQTFKTNIESILFELTSIKENQQQQQLYLSNNYIKAFFDPITGYLKSIKDNNGEELDIFLSFVRYGARGKNPARTDGGDSLSGAYLFLPDGPAVELESNKNQFVIVKGIVREYIFVNGPPDFGINHQLILDKNSKTFTLLNHVNMESSWLSKSYKSSKNFELAMKLKIPSIKQDNFYTDLNGFQMIRRRKQNNLPLQAHFYPMPGSAFIENSNDIRVSLYGRQALGVASLELGEIQVMLDRRLLQDDDLGLGQAVDDNIRAESQFLLNIERFIGTRSVSNDTVGFHSLLGEYASLKLLYPPIILFGQKTSLPTNSFSGLKNPFPCDIHPVAFRTLSESTIYGLRNTIRDTSPKYEAALVLRRFGIECTLDSSLENDDKNCGEELSINKA